MTTLARFLLPIFFLPTRPRSGWTPGQTPITGAADALMAPGLDFLLTAESATSTAPATGLSVIVPSPIRRPPWEWSSCLMQRRWISCPAT